MGRGKGTLVLEKKLWTVKHVYSDSLHLSKLRNRGVLSYCLTLYLSFLYKFFPSVSRRRSLFNFDFGKAIQNMTILDVFVYLTSLQNTIDWDMAEMQ